MKISFKFLIILAISTFGCTTDSYVSTPISNPTSSRTQSERTPPAPLRKLYNPPPAKALILDGSKLVDQRVSSLLTPAAAKKLLSSSSSKARVPACIFDADGISVGGGWLSQSKLPFRNFIAVHGESRQGDNFQSTRFEYVWLMPWPLGSERCGGEVTENFLIRGGCFIYSERVSNSDQLALLEPSNQAVKNILSALDSIGVKVCRASTVVGRTR